MHRFKLPDIGEGVVEAEIVEWKVREGEAVAVDQPLVELMTDKASFEIPSPVAGRVQRCCFREGDIVKVGEVLVEIDDGPAAASAAPLGSRAPEPRPAEPSPARVAVAPAAAPAAPVVPPPSAAPASAMTDEHHPPAMPARPTSRQRASATFGEDGVNAVPAVRELARRLGVDLQRVAGSGPGGRIMRRDVEQAARDSSTVTPASVSTPTDAPSAPEAIDPDDWKRVPLRGVRRAIARHMLEARHRAAHFSYVEEVDLTELVARREQLAASGGEPPSPLAFLARAVVRALPAHPALNASLDDARGDLIVKSRIHLGIAVATDDGLIVPVVHDAAALDTRGLAARIQALSTRARDGALTPEETRGGTFTITSLGKLGGIVSTPIVNYPEAAILGVNAIRKLPRYVGDRIEPRQLVNLSMSVDHRIADGYHCARFVADLRAILESVDFPDFFDGGA
ncbi:MAG: dihydrolipoamide acetyltransferase family protein [bacterium]